MTRPRRTPEQEPEPLARGPGVLHVHFARGERPHLAERFAEEQGTRFRRYDLRHVESAEQWLETAEELGWLRGRRRKRA